MTAADPLIVSGRAQRRLRVLLQGAGPPWGDGTLPAALLAEPVAVQAPAGSAPAAWQAQRDPLAELAVSVRALQALKLPAGTLVQVSNAARPGVAPRLARLLALPSRSPGCGAGPADGAAHLAPSLAFNLGLALHLWPLLHPASACGTDSGGGGGGNSAPGSSGPPAAAGPGRVHIRRYDGGPVDAAGEQQVWLLEQPGGEPVAVPVAAEVAFSLVRLPQSAVLQPRPRAGGGEGGGEGGDAPPLSPSSDAEHGGGEGGAAPRPAASAASDDAVAALQQWLLAAKRVVSQGDVLALPRVHGASGGRGGDASGGLLPDLLPNLHAAAAAHAAAPPDLLHFRVSRLALPGGAEQAQGSCGAAAIDPAATAVKLAGSCSSGLPVGLPHYLAAAPAALAGGRPTAASGSAAGGGGWASGDAEQQQVLGVHSAAAACAAPALHPAGPVLPGWRPLAQLLASALHPGAAGVPLRLAVLLHGPPGCGKGTAAAAAAAAAGCHLVSLSAHDVKAAAGAAERHTFEGLRAAFAAAADYAPAVLLLRQFSVLGDGGSHGGSGAASAHSYAARLGSVLADCVCSQSGGSSASSGGSGGGGAGQRVPAPVVLVACAPSADDLPQPLRRCFTHELRLDAPDQRQRRQLLHGALGAVPAVPGWGADADAAARQATEGQHAAAQPAVLDGGSLEETARHTAGLLPRELRAVAADAAAAAALQALPPAAVLAAAGGGAEQRRNGSNGRTGAAAVEAEGAAARARPALSQEHLAAAVEAVRQRTATDIGAPKIPSVRWEDVGGLQDCKRAILDTVELPLKHPELFAGGLRRRSGVLLYGPPGTGKTLLAKAVATECSLSFLSVKGPELINMYVGESERQIREVFERARRARPCIIFFDELDSLAPARGKGSDSGGVMDRVVSQLLAEIDGVQGGAGSGDVFLVGATNRPDLLDPALLRPGRLDRLLYVGIAADVPSRLQVLQALTRRFRLAPGVDLAAVAGRCADRFTGADLYALCSDAWMTALKRAIAAQEEAQQLAAGEQAGGRQRPAAEQAPGEVEVTQEDFVAAAGSLQPSLRAEEVAKYEAIRDSYAGQQRTQY